MPPPSQREFDLALIFAWNELSTAQQREFLERAKLVLEEIPMSPRPRRRVQDRTIR